MGWDEVEGVDRDESERVGFPRIRRSSFTVPVGLDLGLNWKRGRGATFSTSLSSFSVRPLIACE